MSDRIDPIELSEEQIHRLKSYLDQVHEVYHDLLDCEGILNQYVRFIQCGRANPIPFQASDWRVYNPYKSEVGSLQHLMNHLKLAEREKEDKEGY